MREKQEARRQSVRGIGLAAMAGIVMVGCETSLEVTNPGPMEDGFLDDPDAHEAVVMGMERDLAEGLDRVGILSASVAREIHPAGSQGTFGILVPFQVGLLEDDAWDHWWWDAPQRGRWVAEDGIRRFSEVLEADEFSSSELVARAHLLAGYGNRLLGENMCQAVIDGEAAEPYTVFLERAEGFFSDARDIAASAGASELVSAAVAGRASVHAYLNNWDEAVSDAAEIPTDFVYNLAYGTAGESEYNRIQWSSANEPFRAYTVWNTVYEDYYPTTGDPRVAWDTIPEVPVGDAAVLDLGTVPWYLQRKYETRDAPIALSKGSEMRLIEAEALLREGDWEGALTEINDLRTRYENDFTGEALAPWEAENEEEVWTILKRERGVTLWLEGRRLGDFRRWEEQDVPGERHPLETVGDGSNLSQQDLCFPIAQSERETNPNIDL